MTCAYTTSLVRAFNSGADDEFEIEVSVKFTVSRFRPATIDDPAEGGEVEILSIEEVTKGGQSILLLPDLMWPAVRDMIEESLLDDPAALLEAARADDFTAADDAADHRREGRGAAE